VPPLVPVSMQYTNIIDLGKKVIFVYWFIFETVIIFKAKHFVDDKYS
jgi:hypothetical protein